MPPRKFLDFFMLLFFFLNFLSFNLVLAINVSFNFPSLTLRNLTLLGDAYLRNGVIGLTRELGVPSSSSGTLVYNNPVTFFDQETNSTASFNTKFTFSINNVNPGSYGDGLAFFISPDDQILGSAGGYLGLVNSSQLTKNKFVAIEFDTRLDAHFNDPNENHVGLDIDSLNSIKTADPILQGIDLKSGNLTTVWIDYKNDLRVLQIFMSYSISKPEKPVLRVDIDLSEYLKEVMYVGFSASTEGSTELHLIQNWSFNTFGFQPVRPRSHPHNVSDNSVNTVPNLPISNSTSKHHNKGRIIDAADKRLNGEFNEEEMKKLLLLGLSCANPDSAERPSMRRVLQILNNEAAPVMVPKMKPSLTFSRDMSLKLEDIVSDEDNRWSD
ncbi:hypothetical protein Pint_03852 [Pistacia integerrima]|uniref:Uncharacterized protein n=1 Tax=Pistacia integerrima TaxID=434235 RepID=A0ACC0Z8W6_9ROSI|nr:hypothetical protein Pint_03852 [Pistacia integerrima]